LSKFCRLVLPPDLRHKRLIVCAALSQIAVIVTGRGNIPTVTMPRRYVDGFAFPVARMSAGFRLPLWALRFVFPFAGLLALCLPSQVAAQFFMRPIG
jgi:hypothetical protein